MRQPALIVVSLGMALERYLWVDQLIPGSIHRPHRVELELGGKGAHVAHAARALGAADVRLLGVVGGAPGAQLRSLAEDRPELHTDLIPGEVATRTCTCLIDESVSTMTEFYEPTTLVSAAEWDQLHERSVTSAATEPGALVALTGSLPRGRTSTDLSALVADLTAAGAVCFVDSAPDNPSVLLRSEPAWLKVNETEACAMIGSSINSADRVGSAADAARTLQDQGAKNVVITLGAWGSVALLEDADPLRITGEPIERGTAVGSGDCYLAGLMTSLSGGDAPRDALALAAAAATANARHALVARFSADELEAALSGTAIHLL